MLVTFHDSIADDQLKYAVIAAHYDGRWIFCRHRDRPTYEIPGGHREPGEPIDKTATRELYEETGARNFYIRPICCYSVAKPSSSGIDNAPTFGKLFFADIQTIGPLPLFEIAEIFLIDNPFAVPFEWTYPAIQPLLLEKAMEQIKP